MSQWFCGKKLGFFVLQKGSRPNVCVACLLQTIQECLVCKIFISFILFPSYEFHVKPRNPLGEGPSSNVVSFSTESGKNFQRSDHHLQHLQYPCLWMHERPSHFILCIQSCSFLPPDWLFTTMPGKSAWDQDCVVWGCKMDRLQEKKTEEPCLVFIAKKMTSSLERAQSFKIYIPDLFASIQLINSFWMGTLGVFLGWCVHRCFCYLFNKAAANSDVVWLK